MKGLDVLKALASGKRVVPKRFKGEYGCYFFALEDGRICYKNRNGVKKIDNIDFIEEYQYDFEIYSADEDSGSLEKDDEYETSEDSEIEGDYSNDEEDEYVRCIDCKHIHELLLFDTIDKTRTLHNLCKSFKNDLIYKNSFSKCKCDKFEKSEYQFKED